MASTYLTRTTGTSPTSRQKFTLSFWCKIDLTSANLDPFGIQIDGNTCLWLEVPNNGTKRLKFVDYYSGAERSKLETNRLFRDPNAFFHIVLAADTTQTTAADRLKLYINGVQETSFASTTYPSQNSNFTNNVGTTTIGKNYDANYFSGIISHFHMTDGYVYDASAFGETDSLTGEWKIKVDPSVNYGNNGFFIFKNGTNLSGSTVQDQSGNSNNFTVGGGTLTKTEDNPSQVFASWNPLIPMNSTFSFANANTTTTTATSYSTNRCNSAICSLGMKSGKYYAEFKLSASTTSGGGYIGITNDIDFAQRGSYSGSTNNNFAQFLSTGWGYSTQGTLWNGSEGTQYNAITVGDIVGLAVDLDANKLYLYHNGSLQNTGGTNITADKEYFFAASDGTLSNTFTWQGNWGQGNFGTTAVSSNSGNGYSATGSIGVFQYQPPTNFTALSTKGLNQ